MVFGPLAFALPMLAKGISAIAPAVLPSLVSGAFNLIGSSKASAATESANMMNMMQAEKNLQLQRDALAMQERGQNFSMEEAVRNREANLSINANNIALQREFAQHGIQWRVQDAMAAGIHPMAALGGSGATFSPAAHISGSPIAQVTAPNPTQSQFSADTSMATALGNMGQDVSRAMSAAMSSAERTEVSSAASAILGLENQKLQNELLKSQLSRLRQTPSTPMPVNQRFQAGLDGQGQAATGKLVEEKPFEREAGDPSNQGRTAGSYSDVTHSRTHAGSYYPVPSKNVKESIEDNFWHETMHFLRNNIAPMMSDRWYKPPPVALRQGHGWSYNPFTGYEQVPTRFHERFTGRR